MKAKLTLRVNEDVVQFTKPQVHADTESVSEHLSQRQAQVRNPDIPSVAAMRGSLKGYVIDDSKQAIRNAYAQDAFTLNC